jgi:hypothetical protein
MNIIAVNYFFNMHGMKHLVLHYMYVFAWYDGCMTQYLPHAWHEALGPARLHS